MRKFRFPAFLILGVFMGFCVLYAQGCKFTKSAENSAEAGAAQEAALGADKNTLMNWGAAYAYKTLTCGGINKVVDGDTVYCDGLKVRVMGMDAPEKEWPDKKGQEPWGTRAQESAKKHITAADRIIVFLFSKNDRYGRSLGHVVLIGGQELGPQRAELLSVLLITEGLAYETCSEYGAQGFIEFCGRIWGTAQRASKPKFEEPWAFRRKMRTRHE